ncbi:hypothetical protein [Rhodococcus daqingensis]|uniref:WXG100 family type VII secretion target n=1 Tax=Rhodococcus daqingensis TaxID=2479363 RepID=A0ABW2RVG4_9NOCA
MSAAGTDELGYFAEFLPRLRSVTGSAIGYDQLGDRYFGPAESALAALREDADVVGAAVATMRAQCDAQRQLILGLAAGWEGDAADSARLALLADLERAHASTETMMAVHAALLEAAEVIRTVVAANATAMSELDATQVGGRTPADVDVMIAVAQLTSGDHAWGLLQQVSGFFAELSPMVPTAVTAGAPVGDRLLGVAVDLASTWLSEVFVPHVQSQVAGVLELCDATARAVDGANQLVLDAMGFAGADLDGTGPVDQVAEQVGGSTPTALAESPVARVAAAEPSTSMVVIEADDGQALQLLRQGEEPRTYRVEIGADGEPYLCDCDSQAREFGLAVERKDGGGIDSGPPPQESAPPPKPSPSDHVLAPGDSAPGSPVPESPVSGALPAAPPQPAREGRTSAPTSTIDQPPAGPGPESGAELAEAGPL